MASAFLPYRARTHTQRARMNGNPKDIYLLFFFFPLSATPFFFASRGFFRVHIYIYIIIYVYSHEPHGTNKHTGTVSLCQSHITNAIIFDISARLFTTNNNNIIYSYELHSRITRNNIAVCLNTYYML